MPQTLPIAVLISGNGTTLQNLIDQIAAGELKARIVTVIASRPNLPGIARAQEAKLPWAVIERTKFASTAEFSREVFGVCDAADADLICLAGWLSLLEMPGHRQGRVMNIHPALLPSFGGEGMYGRHVHEAVLAHGCKISGCTVHFVDASYDNGPIILQRSCSVLETDTPVTLAGRVFEEEKIAYPEAIRLYQAGQLRLEGRKVRVG